MAELGKIPASCVLSLTKFGVLAYTCYPIWASATFVSLSFTNHARADTHGLYPGPRFVGNDLHTYTVLALGRNV